MQVVYSKGSLDRKRKYQVITMILVNDTNEMVILKKPADGLAVPHIRQTYQNECLYELSHPSYLVKSELRDDVLITPYIKGTTLGEKLRRAFIEQDQNLVCQLLEQWRSVLIGEKSNICKYRKTKEFASVFGALNIPEGVLSTRISNFDCTNDNVIIMDDGTIKCIDLEWVFDMPVPVDFNMYRVVKGFYIQNSDICIWNELLDLSKINKKYIDAYEKGIEAFYTVVNYDMERNIRYGTFGRTFKNPIIETSVGQKKNLYKFPEKINENYNSIVVYGAGKVGQDFASYIGKSEDLHLAGWVDKRAALYRNQGMDIGMPDELQHLTYDVILIAVANQSVAKEIEKELMVAGIEQERMYWCKPELL